MNKISITIISLLITLILYILTGMASGCGVYLLIHLIVSFVELQLLNIEWEILRLLMGLFGAIVPIMSIMFGVYLDHMGDVRNWFRRLN